MSEQVTIYALSDPAKPSLIRYIGKTEDPLQRRLSGHLFTAKTRHYRVSKWIQSVLSRGKRPLIWPIEICTALDWEERERFWIRLFRSLPGFTNVLDGGQKGMTGFRHSDETKALYKAQRAGKKPHPNNIAVTIARNRLGLSPGIRNKISKTLTGSKLSEATKQKIFRSAGFERAQIQLKECNTARKKTVRCFETGQSFHGIGHAAQALGVQPSHLQSHIRHGWKVHGLHYYLSGTVPKIAPPLKGRKLTDSHKANIRNSPGWIAAQATLRRCNESKMVPVLCFETGQKFPCAAEAAKFIGVSRPHLANHMRRAWKVRGLHFYKEGTEPIIRPPLSGRRLSPSHVAAIKRSPGWVRAQIQLRNHNERQKKPIVCIETGQIFGCVSDAAKHAGSSKQHMLNHIRKRFAVHGFHYARQ